MEYRGMQGIQGNSEEYRGIQGNITKGNTCRRNENIGEYRIIMREMCK